MSSNASTDEVSLEKENRSLRKRVDELERTLSDIQSPNQEAIPRTRAERWKIAVLGILLFASTIPSYFVMQDRWFQAKINIESVNQIWWDNTFLKSLPYPQYFLLIFLATLLTVLIVLLWREKPMLVFSNLTLGVMETTPAQSNPKQRKLGNYMLVASLLLVDVSAIWMIAQGRIPGWELLLALLLYVSALAILDSQVVSLKDRFREHGRFILDTALFIIALCCALYATFGEDKPNLVFYLLFVLASINFFKHRKQVPFLFWICIASLVALTWNLDSWHYVVIGDEYIFYTEILSILDNRTPWQLVNLVFNGNLVYGTHPYFSSYIQDFFMKLFDNRNFGWRFTNPVLVTCSLPLFYYFFKEFIPRRTAVTIVILLGFSHYLLSFSKIGYNNLQSLFIMGAVLASFTWAIRSMRLLAFCVTGLTMGLCFYLYPAALYVIPLPVIGLLFFLPPTNREAIRRWGWMLLSMSLLLYPLAAQPRYWEAKIPGTFLYTDVSSSAGTLVENILRNTLFSAYSYLFIPEQTHYVSVGYLDVLSSMFVVIGFVALIKAILQRNRSALFLIASFLMMFIVVGATHGRNFPTATRMFLLLPWFALFTALGLEWSLEKTRSLFRDMPEMTGALIVGAIVFVNIYQTYVIDVRNMTHYHTLAPMFVKTVREITARTDIAPKSYVFAATPEWGPDGMKVIQRAYRVPDSARQILQLDVEGDQFPNSAQELLSQPEIVVIVKGDMEENIRNQLGIQLLSWGKSRCEIRNGNGALQFQLWHSGDLGWLCQ